MEDFNVLVIGAGKAMLSYNIVTSTLTTSDVGVSGLSAAKFYLDVHPDCRLSILDRDHFVGGTWNSSK